MTIHGTGRIPLDMVSVSVAVSALLQVSMLWIVSRALQAMHARDFSVYRVA